MPLVAVLVAVVLVLAVGCRIGESEVERSDRLRAAEAVRIIGVVSTAISYPRQVSAAGFTRAAQQTAAAQDGRLTVIESAERDNGGDLLKPIAHLVYRLHFTSVDASGYDASQPQTDYCYAQDYTMYGAAGSPSKVGCPAGAVSVTPPPAPPAVAIPNGADVVVERVLRRGLGAGATKRSISAVLARAASAAQPKALPPEVSVLADGARLGVALRGAPGECLFATRTEGGVATRTEGNVVSWRMEREQAMPGEIGCDARNALAGAGTTSPH